jgi:hypothetical protein
MLSDRILVGNIYNGETFEKFCGEKSDDSLVGWASCEWM